MRDPKSNVYTPDAWETIVCPVCNSDKYHEYEKFGSEMQYTYVLCDKCSLVYTNPRPVYNEDFISSSYSSYYQFAENLGLADLEKVRESSLGTFKEELEHISQYDKHKTSVLDIGSAMGTFLLAAAPYYKVRIGLDVSEQMAKFVRERIGLEVYIKQFDAFEHEPFSLIHMSHVIEHIPNPKEWIEKAYQLLIKDGILVINVPNKFGLGNRLQHWLYKLKLKKQFSSGWKDPTRTPDHLFEPTVKSFRYLLAQSKFELLDYYTYSRKDPASKKSLLSRLMNRSLNLGGNLTFVCRKNG
jgi:SAM-dependent methyltransferase